MLLAFPPFRFYPAAVAAFTFFFAQVTRAESGRRAAGFGFLGHFFFFLVFIRWVVGVHRIGPLGLPAWVALSAVESLPLMLFAPLARRVLCRGRLNALGVVSLPALFSVLEYLRVEQPAGFPWGVVGYAALGALPLARSASLWGVHGLSFLTGLLGLLLFGFLFTDRRLPFVLGLIAVTVCAAGLAPIGVRGVEKRGELVVALLQGNTPKGTIETGADAVAQVRLYRELAEGHRADLLVFPETTFPGDMADGEQLEVLLKTWGALPGVKVVGTYFDRANVALVLDQKANLVARYEKQQLVPFGEVVPARKLFLRFGYDPWGAEDTRRGDLTDPVGWDGVRAGVQICYETAFESVARLHTKQGAQLLIGLVADSWFPPFQSVQHTDMYRMRAIENHRFAVRAADTGISAIIAPDGRLRKILGPGRRGRLEGEVTLYEGRTFYAAYAPQLWAAGAGLALLALLLPGWSRGEPAPVYNRRRS